MQYIGQIVQLAFQSPVLSPLVRSAVGQLLVLDRISTFTYEITLAVSAEKFGREEVSAIFGKSQATLALSTTA